MPDAQGALVALDPNDGAVAALVGGFDYFGNKFNRVTQARRQPGSGFKPFLYSCALENGFTPSTIVMDAPIVYDDSGQEKIWRPENDEQQLQRADAPARSAGAFAQPGHDSRGARSSASTPRSTTRRTSASTPTTCRKDLTLALGSLPATPLQMATGYAVFANGGYRVDSYFIERIEDASGQVGVPGQAEGGL